ncbi:MAG TPA: putative Ig domain-containing protein, partial [Gaiellaceae bacterium]
LQASRTFVVKVESAAEPPLLTPPGPKVAVIGQQLQFTLHASDLDQDPLQFSAQGLPTNATLVAGVVYGTAVFTWTPAAADAGTHPVTFTVTDSTGGSDSATINIVARATNAAPVLLPVGNQTVAEGGSLDLALAAVDPDHDPLTWSVTGLPPGAHLDPVTGHLTWQPGYDAAGTYSGIALTVTDGAATSTETIGVTVTQTDRAPQFSSLPPLGGQEERLLQFTLVATDPDGDAVVYAPAAPLPQGAAFDGSNGRFTWTPTYDQSGAYTLSFTARDSSGLFDTLQVQVNIADVNRAPSLSFTSHRVVLGDTLQFTIGASDPDSGDTLAFSASGLPDGATLDPATGAFSWTPGPGQIATYPVTVSVTDGKSVVSRGLELAVDPQPVGPSTTIVVTPSFPAVPGQSVSITVLASALSAIASRTLTLSGAPLSLDANGRVVITAPATGVYQLVATATDIDGFTSTTTSELRVRDASDNTPPTVALDPGLGGRQVIDPIAITGSVADSNLESWTLEIARTGDAHFTAIASGSGPITGPLATLDPSRFEPSFYELRLTATDVAGRSAQATTELELASAASAGSDFVHTVTDFTAAFAGDILAFTRTYDSADAFGTGSFGAGWSLDWRDLSVSTDVAATGSESSGVYNPLQAGSRLIVSTPDGGRAGFTFSPQQITGEGFTYFLPAWTPDPGVTWQLDSASLPLQRAAGKFYALDDGRAYNPAALAGDPAEYTLTDTAGTQYAFDVVGGVTSVTFADGTTLLVGDSGVVGPGNETIGFTEDRSGRLTQVTTPGGSFFDYTYDASGNLVGARNLEAGTSERYAYVDPAQHLLTLVAGPAGGISIAYGATVTTRPVTEDLGAALAYLDHPVDGVLADGGADLYTLAVRPSEVALPQAGAFLLAVDVRAAGGSTLAPALPDIEGLHPIVARTSAGDAYAVFRVTSAALLTLHVVGTGAGAYVLDLHAAGDVNGDQAVDGLDMAALAAALGTSSGDAGYLPAADVNGDGRIDATDRHLVVADLGFSADQAPQIGTGSGFTHVDLETSIDVSSFVLDPENDP